MQRREFITLLGGTAAAWPLATRAQTQRKMARIGYLGAGIRNVIPNPRDAFLQGLRDLGYVEGQNFVLVDRYAEGQQERLPEFAVELVRLDVDIIVAPTSGSAKAAKDATQTIPIVMAGSGDPVGLGLVASLARPGGNVTGPSMMTTEIVARAPEDFEAAFAAATRGNAGALIALDDALTYNYRTRVVALAAASRLPALYGYREFPDEGGLMSYGANLLSHYRHAADYVDKILRGAKPGDIPVEQPTKFDLVLNLKTAKALGVIMPPTLLARADEVIE
jgi:putative ABC transport system substrate-binding protein